MSQGARKRNEAKRKLAEMRRQQQRRQRRIQLLAGAGVLIVVAVIVALVVTLTGGKTTTAAAVRGMAQGATVDGIACQTTEQAVYHIHEHLAIYANGTQGPVPAGIGIPGPQQVSGGFVEGGKCLYWLHTHDASGVIHVESPARRTYTLGQFFDIWGQPLSSTQVGRATGHVTAFVNGKQYSGNPRSIQLTPHAVIQLDVGTAVPPHSYKFPAGL